MPSKKGWEQALCDRFNAVADVRRAIKLPAGIDFAGGPEKLTLNLGTSAGTANQQDDNGAFESWALAFRSWLEVGKVALTWTPHTSARRLHYNRFLFRLKRFVELC